MSLSPPRIFFARHSKASRRHGRRWRESIPAKARRRRPAAAFIGLLLSAGLLPGAEPLQQPPAGDEIPLTVGRSVVLDHPDEIRRVAIADETVADAIVISTREMLINGKTPGLTSMVIWSRSGDRNFFTINVKMNVEQVQEHIRTSFPGEPIRLSASNGVVTLAGKASGPDILERVVAMITGSVGNATIINNVELPPPPAARQIMLKVKFIEVDRQAMQEFGAGLMSTGAFNTPAAISTQQFGGGSVNQIAGQIPALLEGTTTNFNFLDVLNIFAFRPDLNVGAIIRALKSKALVQILAEPNVVTTDGKEASFLVGGEFPVPVVQGGATSGAITIQFREFGIRFDFLPNFTERGTVKMRVTPEVSALDFANAVSIQGFLVPALSTRRVETEVELAPGQSFVVGGLIDRRIADTVSRIPGLSSIPLIGRIFKSYSREQQASDLIVVVTPEFPEVIDVGQPRPMLPMPYEFMEPLSEYVERLRVKEQQQ